MKSFICSIMVIIIYSSVCYGADSKNESWYTYWEIGYPIITYPDYLQDVVDTMKDNDFDNTSVNIGVLGLYLPFNNHRTMTGIIFDGCGDAYEGFGQKMQINSYTYSLSFMHFLSSNIGNGLFIRGDVGGAKMSMDMTGFDEETSDWGLGFLVGGGYSIPLGGGGTRITLNAHYAYKKIEEEKYSKVTFSIGGLF